MKIRGQLFLTTLAGLTVGLLACSDDSVPVDTGVPDGGDIGIGDGPITDAPPNPCVLKITKINGSSVGTVGTIDPSFDQDLTKSGIQIEVEVTGTNLADGTDVSLNITSQSPDLAAKASGGTVLFKDVMIPSSLTQVVLLAYTTGCTSSSVQKQVEPTPECEFTAPQGGVTLGTSSNKTPGTGKFTFDVQLTTTNAVGGSVSLEVDGNPVSGTQTPDTLGKVTFADTVLPPQKMGVVLKSTVTVGQVTRTCDITINIQTTAPACDIGSFTPAPSQAAVTHPIEGPVKPLGIAQDAKPSTPAIDTTIAVNTSTTVTTVTLKVDGAVKTTLNNVTGGSATFNAVDLTDGPRVLEATCVDPGGNFSISPPVKVYADSKAPAAVTDFACSVTNHRTGSITCSWTAVSDVGSGMARYLVRYLVGSNITTANWATATVTPDVPASISGVQSVVIDGLPLAETYFFGIRSQDWILNDGDLDDAGTGQGLLLDLKKLARPAVAGASGWGSTMATGDFNCDGHSDVAVGSPEFDGKGRVYIYLGNANGTLASPEKILSGTVAGGKFGARVVALSNFDKDADNCADLLVYASYGGTKDARAYLYLGRKLFSDREDVTPGIGAEVVFQLGASAASTELLGQGMASAGDFDNDGASDLVLTHTDTASGTDSSTLLVVYGDSALTLMGGSKTPVVKTLPGDAAISITGGKASDSLGYSMAPGAKLDSDAYADLWVGASTTTGGGAAYVIKGGARASTLSETFALTDARVVKIAGGTGSVAFGSTVAYVGDMDKDGSGLPEFAAADPGFGGNTGQVYIFNFQGTTAPASIADAAATVTHTISGAAGDKFGAAMGSANFSKLADLDDDGYADLLVGVETMGTTGAGAVFQISGAATLTGLSSSTASYTFLPGTGSVSFGATITLISDLNKDGFVDVALSDPGFNSGQGTIYFYY